MVHNMWVELICIIGVFFRLGVHWTEALIMDSNSFMQILLPSKQTDWFEAFLWFVIFYNQLYAVKLCYYVRVTVFQKLLPVYEKLETNQGRHK